MTSLRFEMETANPQISWESTVGTSPRPPSSPPARSSTSSSPLTTPGRGQAFPCAMRSSGQVSVVVGGEIHRRHLGLATGRWVSGLPDSQSRVHRRSPVGWPAPSGFQFIQPESWWREECSRWAWRLSEWKSPFKFPANLRGRTAGLLFGCLWQQ